jgi:1,4-alpha-glucan branching enzyme
MSTVATVPTQTRITQEHISNDTPMGANLVANGATFRVWAPGAEQAMSSETSTHGPRVSPGCCRRDPLVARAGFLPEVNDGTFYKFWVQGGFPSNRPQSSRRHRMAFPRG